jgi:DNA mismatch repair protein MutL
MFSEAMPMQSIIKLLPDHIANQIAAGEVIQRPASVVKELVENAIDAGAGSIAIEIKDAGKTLIRVTDDGHGMSSSDARLCFVRHATSKIASADDLFALKTKGFRGEALASIAAIAYVRLRTCQNGEEIGTLLELEGSQVTTEEPCAGVRGTSIEVKNLFFNVPARRNFLKSDTVEFNHILDEFERIALPHPEISFRLINNNQEVYHLISGGQRKRVIDLLGKQSNEKLVPIEETTEIVSVNGYVGKPDFAKKTRGNQYFFVNGRFFKDSYFHHAVMKAFEGMIPEKTYPAYVLFLEVNPAKIDVNVHPTKTEIKFEEDRFIYAILMSSIRQALGKYNIAPTLDFDRETGFDIPVHYSKMPVQEPVIRVNEGYNPFQASPLRSEQSPGMSKQGFGSLTGGATDWKAFYTVEDEVEEPPPTMLPFNEVSSHFDCLVRTPYLIASCKSGVMVIHISRAQSRITFETLLEKLLLHPLDSQTILFPFEYPVYLSQAEHWKRHGILIRQLGFSGDLEEEKLVIHAMPSFLQPEHLQQCLDALFAQFALHDEQQKEDLLHAVLSSISVFSSSKHAVRNPEEANALVEKLFQCTEHSHTPQGKPIIKTLTFEEIQHWF